jgi:two-component system, NtrC family, nitrogen regulation sensor histidine kinase NtrY
LKHLLNNKFNRNIFLLLAAIGLFCLAFLLNKYILGTTTAHYYTSLIQNRIQQKEKDFQRLIADTALISILADQRYDEATLEKLLDEETGYDLFIYDKTNNAEEPTLLFWNTQTVLPELKKLTVSRGSSMVQLPNGEYVYTGREITYSNGRRLFVVSLVPVMWKYFVEIENLKREFVGFNKATRQVEIVSTPTGFPVKNTYGNVLFYLQKVSLNVPRSNMLSIAMVIAGFFLLFLYMHQSAHAVAERFGIWYGVLLLAGTILLLRLATYFFPDILNLRQFELFDPSIYGSSYVLSSLGDLLINVLLLCWIIIFINRRVNVAAINPYKQGYKNWMVVAVVITVHVVVTFALARILQTLVADGKISFNVTNFFALISTPYSFVGFVVLATLALSYFFLSQVLLTLAGKMVGHRNYFAFIIAAGVGLIILSFTANTSVVELNLYVLPWLLVFMWLMQQRIFSGLNFRLNVSEVLFWLFVFSFSMSAVIIFENRKIELDKRKRYAEKLGLQADPANERLLSVAFTYLDSNFLSQNFNRFRDPKVNAYLKDSIINSGVSFYVSKYDTKIFTFDSSGRSLYNKEAASYDTLNTIFRVQGKKTNSLLPTLRYFERSFDRFSYIFRHAAIDSNGATLGYLFVLSDPRRYKSDALTPEIFKQSREMVPDYSSGYSYAIYDTVKLITNYNDYPFPTRLSPDQIPNEEVRFRQKDGYEEFWFRPSASTIVVITRKDNYFIEAITLFAYLFSTFLFLLSFYRFISFLVRSRFRSTPLKQYWQLSIRSQIHSTIIMVSLLSFIVIGIATILFFINRYQRNNQDRLTRAAQIMVSQVQGNLKTSFILDNGTKVYAPFFTDEMEKKVREISDVHGMDVNLYDTLGNLRTTSNPDMDIYSNGVLSTKMNPLAYYRLFELCQIQTVTEETVGRIDYLSIYSPVRDDKGRAMAFLNIPSFTSQSELKQEISNFMVTVINLNAFIFLVAGAIALFITNRITSSFTVISQKMRDINLRKMNEEIEWKRDDEIGVLVKEYNKMVQKLDESAEALAKSEREGAWRQMARQVAHEIKNPLTPMKLSIQYLQKAIDNNHADVKGMTTNVAKTLIEQIDHLSKIASDFSQFANIGNPKNEVFDLHEMLYSLSSLYEATDNLQFEWQRVPNRVLLFADKTQLNRLFTNLLQNAIEASASRSEHIVSMKEELNGEYVTVSVTDNGEGIPEQTRSMIFTPNFTTKSSGTGLGLAMSKSIVEQAKGELWFITKEGEGTTFFVKLPLLRATS